MPVNQIAAEIGRHRSTVYREITRNRFEDNELPYLNGYYGVSAQRCADARRARRRKLVRLEDLRNAVIAQLKEGWSPEQIAGRLGYERHPVRVSHETIYAYVYSPDGQSEGLARHLPSRRRKRRPRYGRKPRGLVFPPDRSIHERPEHVTLAALSNRSMKAICDRLNGTPRKCLGWQTPAEAFREEMMKLR